MTYLLAPLLCPASLMAMNSAPHATAYWRANLKILAALLVVWFTVSLGCGVLWVDALDQIQIGGFKLGFWFAQQGSIYVFVVLIFVYVVLMNRLDRKYGYDDGSPYDDPYDPDDIPLEPVDDEDQS